MTPVSFLLVLVLAAPASVQPVPPDIETLQKLMERQASAIESGDLPALEEMYAPDVVVFENGGENRGWADYRDHHLGPELKELKDLRYRRSNAVVSANADLAWAIFDYELHAVVKGSPVAINGKGTLIFKRGPAGWKIAHEHSSGRRAKQAR